MVTAKSPWEAADFDSHSRHASRWSTGPRQHRDHTREDDSDPRHTTTSIELRQGWTHSMEAEVRRMLEPGTILCRALHYFFRHCRSLAQSRRTYTDLAASAERGPLPH